MTLIQKPIQVILTLMAAFLLSACVSVLPKTAPAAPRYTIAPLTAEEAEPLVESQSGNEALRLLVDDPTTSQLFNTVKIPLSRMANRYEFFAGTEWADRMPVLFQRAMIRSFENSGGYAEVGDFAEVSRGDFTLKTDIRAFNAVYENGLPKVNVEIFSKLIDARGTHVASERFANGQDIAADDLALVMNGFDSAIDMLLVDLVRWSEAEINAYREENLQQDTSQ